MVTILPPAIAPLLTQLYILVCLYGLYVTIIIELNIIKLAFVQNMQCTYTEAEYLNTVYIKLVFLMVNTNVQAVSFF